ncbi:MAG: BrnT family toxin [Sedimentisphaerales bacterium]
MDEIRFSWDAQKAKQNLAKHKVSFEEASTVFFDERAIEFFDPDHSEQEDRFLMLGLSCRLRVLVVSYCFRKKGLEIRIISARRATSKEQKVYNRGKK